MTESAAQFTYQAPTYFPIPFHLQNAYSTFSQVAPAPVAATSSPSVATPIAPVYPAAHSFPQYQQVATAPVAATSSPSVATPIAPVYPAAHSFPQYQQAQQLFQNDAQIITPEALATVKAAIASSTSEQKIEAKKKAIPRRAAGLIWEDPTLADWPERMISGCLY